MFCCDGMTYAQTHSSLWLLVRYIGVDKAIFSLLIGSRSLNAACQLYAASFRRSGQLLGCVWFKANMTCWWCGR